MIKSSYETLGQLKISLYDKDGQLKKETTVPNMVVYTGKVFITQSMVKTTTNTPPAMSHMALGVGNVAPITSNTTLMTEFSGGGNSRAAMSANVAGNVVTYSATFAAGNCTGAITEAGIFNAASAGTMLARTVFDVFNKDVSDTLIISWNLTNI